MDDPGPPKSSLNDSTKTTIGVLVAMAVVLIVAGIGIATGTIDAELFAVIVAMSVLTTLVVPPVLRRLAAPAPAEP